MRLTWSASCSSGAYDYAIYEGEIGTWYSHTSIDCSDEGGDLTETVTTGAGSRYYLVIPHNAPNDEGSCGSDSTGAERPGGSTRCVATQAQSICH